MGKAMSSILGTEDAIANAMLNGVKNQFEYELRKELMQVAEREVAAIVERVSDRMMVQIREYWQDSTFTHKIDLSWYLKKE